MCPGRSRMHSGCTRIHPRPRAHIFGLLSRCPPRTLALLAEQHGLARQREGLAPAAVLRRLARLLQATLSAAAARELEDEVARQLKRLPSAASGSAEAEAMVRDELQRQADGVRLEALGALTTCATAEALCQRGGGGGGGAGEAEAEAEAVAPLFSSAEALLRAPCARVAAAARRLLAALWAARDAPLPRCLERCHACSDAEAASAHFLALAALTLRGDGGGLPAEQQAAVLVLALLQLSNGEDEVRGAAQRVLQHVGGVAPRATPAALLGEALPWAAAHAQQQLSQRLARALPRLAPKVVGEALRRAAAAPPAARGALLLLVRPWVAQVGLMLLPASSAAQPPPTNGAAGGVGDGIEGRTAAATAAAVAEAAEAEAEARQAVGWMLDAQLHHVLRSSQLQGEVAERLLELWRALATDARSVPALLAFLHARLRDGVPLRALAPPDAAAGGRRGLEALSARPSRVMLGDANSEATRRGLLQSLQAAMLGISHAQPAPCARGLARWLALPARLEPPPRSMACADEVAAIARASTAACGADSFSPPFGCEPPPPPPPGETTAAAAAAPVNVAAAPALRAGDDAVWAVRPPGGGSARDAACAEDEATVLLLAAVDDAALRALLQLGPQDDAPPPPPLLRCSSCSKCAPPPPRGALAAPSAPAASAFPSAPVAPAAPPLLGFSSSGSMEAELLAEPEPPSPLGPPPSPLRKPQLAPVLHAALLLRLNGRAQMRPYAGRLLARLVHLNLVANATSGDSAATCAHSDESRAAALMAALLHGTAGDDATNTTGNASQASPLPWAWPASTGTAGGGGTPAAQALEGLVGGLLACLTPKAHPRWLLESWADVALQLAAQHAALADGAAAVAVRSLEVYRALVPPLCASLLRGHARVLLHAACTCAAELARPHAACLIRQLLLAADATLRREHAAADALHAEAFWRAAAAPRPSPPTPVLTRSPSRHAHAHAHPPPPTPALTPRSGAGGPRRCYTRAA